MHKAKRIVILGSTGSIGTQCLDVVRSLPGRFEVIALAAGSSVDLLAEQAREFRVARIVVGDPAAHGSLAALHPDLAGSLEGSGKEGLVRLAGAPGCDLVINALVGVIGLVPTLAALESGTDVALANKESLVVGGELLLAAARETGARILPVDSEHSGLFQALKADGTKPIRRIIITASGGPFRNWSSR